MHVEFTSELVHFSSRWMLLWKSFTYEGLLANLNANILSPRWKYALSRTSLLAPDPTAYYEVDDIQTVESPLHKCDLKVLSPSMILAFTCSPDSKKKKTHNMTGFTDCYCCFHQLITFWNNRYSVKKGKAGKRIESDPATIPSSIFRGDLLCYSGASACKWKEAGRGGTTGWRDG